MHISLRNCVPKKSFEIFLPYGPMLTKTKKNLIFLLIKKKTEKNGLEI